MILRTEDLTKKYFGYTAVENVNLEIPEGETHVLMGPNGTGKSTLGYALIGHPKYEVTEGSIVFNGEWNCKTK